MTLPEIRNLFTRKPFTVGAFFGKEEEGFCDQCGCPLHVGDQAQEIWWEYEKTEPVAFVCASSACASAEIAKRAESELESFNS